MPITLLLTRPADAAARFAEPYNNHPDLTVICAPVVVLQDVPAVPPDTKIDAIILSSRAAVQRAVAILQERRYSAYCVGAETAKMATAAGFDLRDQAPTAHELTARIVAQKPNETLMHFRGRHSTGAIASTLSAAGVPCAETLVYEQVSQELCPIARDSLQNPGVVIAPIFSRFAAQALAKQIQPLTAQLILVAISSSVKTSWTGPNPTLSYTAETPDGTAMHNAVRRALVAAQRLEAGQGKS